MLDIIANNPFRVLGVYGNCKQVDVVRNAGRMKAFINVGKQFNFPTDFTPVLPELNRNLGTVQDALSSINLPADRLRYALFWFLDVDDNDHNGLGFLAKGDINQAYRAFATVDSFSSNLNNAVLSLVREDYSAAVASFDSLIHNEQRRLQFCHLVCDETVELHETVLSHYILDELRKSLDSKTLLSIISNKDDYSYVREIAIQEPLAVINSEIAKAKRVPGTDPAASLQAGKDLYSATIHQLNIIEDIVGTEDIAYSSAADNLAKQILQCGINYYNNSNDHDKAKQALGVQKQALDLAKGKLVKDRCQKNYDILLKAIGELPPESVASEVAEIQKAIKAFVSKPDLIKYSLELIKSCLEPIKRMQSVLGKKNPCLLKYTTLVANNALHNVIEEVNHSQSQLSDENIERITLQRLAERRRERHSSYDPFGYDPLIPSYRSILDSEDFIRRSVRIDLLSDLRESLSQGWLVIKYLNKWPYEESFYQERYLPNRNTLRKLCKQTGSDMKHDKYSYLDFFPLDEPFESDETFGKIQLILCGALWLGIIIFLLVKSISQGDGVIGPILGGLFGGGIAAGLFVYVIIIVTDIGIALINCILWIMNQLTRKR